MIWKGVLFVCLSFLAAHPAFAEVAPPTPTCTSSPSVSVSPSVQQTSTVGQILEYQAVVTNNDPIGCPSSTYSLQIFLDRSLTNISPASLQLSPGQSGSAQIQVEWNPYIVDQFFAGGFYLTVRAINSATGVWNTGRAEVASIAPIQIPNTLTISPAHSAVKLRDLMTNNNIKLTFLLSSSQGPIAGQNVGIIITGITGGGSFENAPYVGYFTTAADGTINFSFFPDISGEAQGILEGTYQVIATTMVQGLQVVGSTTFTIEQ